MFGPHTCRIGGCGLDGTVGVDLPCVRYETRHEEPDEFGRTLVYAVVPSSVRIYFCERHAAEAIAECYRRRAGPLASAARTRAKERHRSPV